MANLVSCIFCSCEWVFTEDVLVTEWLSFVVQIVVGTIAVRGVHLDSKPPAFEEFEAACNMFQSAAEISNRAARAMVGILSYFVRCKIPYSMASPFCR